MAIELLQFLVRDLMCDGVILDMVLCCTIVISTYLETKLYFCNWICMYVVILKFYVLTCVLYLVNKSIENFLHL